MQHHKMEHSKVEVYSKLKYIPIGAVPKSYKSHYSTILKYYSCVSMARRQRRGAAAMMQCGVLYWKIIICLNVVNGSSDDDTVWLRHRLHAVDAAVRRRCSILKL